MPHRSRGAPQPPGKQNLLEETIREVQPSKELGCVAAVDYTVIVCGHRSGHRGSQCGTDVGLFEQLSEPAASALLVVCKVTGEWHEEHDMRAPGICRQPAIDARAGRIRLTATALKAGARRNLESQLAAAAELMPTAN